MALICLVLGTTFAYLEAAALQCLDSYRTSDQAHSANFRMGMGLRWPASHRSPIKTRACRRNQTVPPEPRHLGRWHRFLRNPWNVQSSQERHRLATGTMAHTASSYKPVKAPYTLVHYGNDGTRDGSRGTYSTRDGSRGTYSTRDGSRGT